jgi:hypothetical protein
MMKYPRLERLESRTVLSASFDAAHFAAEHVEVVDTRWDGGVSFEPRFDAPHVGGIYPSRDVQPFAEPGPYAAARAYAPVAKSPQQFAVARPDRMATIFVVHIYPTLNTKVETKDDFEAWSGISPEDPQPPQRAQAPTSPGDNYQQEPVAGAGVTQPAQPGVAGASRYNAVNTATTLPSFYSSYVETGTVTKSVSMATRRVHEAVFQDFSSRQLLLTASNKLSAELNSEGEVDSDPRRGGLGNPDEELEAFAASRVRDEVATSLDILQCERDAIDQVLGELHEPANLADAHLPNAASSRQRTAAEAFFVVEADRATAALFNNKPPENGSDGGMVLLVASGDANSSAYDLAGEIFGNVDNMAVLPTGMEAAIGVYQAFDIGGEGRAAAARDTRDDNSVAVEQDTTADRGAGA